MGRKLLILLITAAVSLSATACSSSGEHTMDQTNRNIILSNDNTNEDRNRLLTEDIQFLKQELPKRHKNMFSIITKEAFNDSTDQLIDKIDQLNNLQVLVELNKIVASIGDAHTNINIWDGYSYPLKFLIFNGNVYVVDTDTSLEEMMFSQVLKIDGVDIDTVIKQLTTLISHENEGWVLSMLPKYLQSPVYMYGLGIIQNEKEAVFTVERGGVVQDFTISAVEFGERPDFISKKTEDAVVKNYEYEYLPEQKTLCFKYNACAEMDSLKFSDFNKEMFDIIGDNVVDKIIVDLRNNTGGNSEILNPFTKRLKTYIAGNAHVKVYILVGRNTFSSGMFAIYRIMESAPDATSVGEPTGGALDCFGEVKSFKLPNSQIPVGYSTKYFEFSKNFSYKNDGVGTFLPDIVVQPSIEDYISGTDVVLEYVLAE